MTKERLRMHSLEELISLAEKEGLEVPDGIGKDELLDQLSELYEEERDEHDRGNNPAMQVKETKYDIVQEETTPTEWDNFPLPANYNETSIKVLLRDPLWAFAYWEIKEADLELLGDPRSTELFLRVCEDPEGRGVKINSVNCYDIPVNITDTCWYINLPKAGTYYYIELYYSAGESEKALCRSSVIKSPVEGYASLKTGGVKADAGNDLVLLSGLYDFEAPSSKNTIPQRIISFLDAQYIQLKD